MQMVAWSVIGRLIKQDGKLKLHRALTRQVEERSFDRIFTMLIEGADAGVDADIRDTEDKNR